jgi:hypothetical protein
MVTPCLWMFTVAFNPLVSDQSLHHRNQFTFFTLFLSSIFFLSLFIVFNFAFVFLFTNVFNKNCFFLTLIDCNRTLYGQVGLKYPLRLTEPFQRFQPFICRVTFAAAGEQYGDIVELTFLSFQIGSFEVAKYVTIIYFTISTIISNFELNLNSIITNSSYVLNC